jgi:hypothetical protein
LRAIDPEQDGQSFCVETVAFDFLITDQPRFVGVSNGHVKVWFETVVDEPVVARGFDCDLCALVLARELFEFGAFGSEPTLVRVG